MTGETFKQLRVAIVGSCQVVGLAAAAKRLLPGAEVKTWHVGVHPIDSDEKLLEVLPTFDLVISQISDRDGHIPLRITRLRDLGLPVVYLPVMAFPGFHPDITYIQGPGGGLLQGLAADYHSVIVASAFTLGLPEDRIPGLFNAYIFSGLGYFEVFDAAKAALFANFLEEGIELAPMFDSWFRQLGQFMYTINHPHVMVLTDLCRLALARAGYIDSGVPSPADVDDYLATHIVWPIYPALGKRIGLSGSTMLLRKLSGPADSAARELPLVDFISGCFEIYCGYPKDALRQGAVAIACDRLRPLIT
jgi:hypothetical protein